MAIQYLNFDTTLGASAQVVATSGPSSSGVITRATMTNNGGAGPEGTVYRGGAGGTPGAGNIIVAPGSVPGTIQAGQTAALPLTGHTLLNGQSLYASVDSGSDVNF